MKSFLLFLFVFCCIRIIAQPANDNCAAAVSLTPGVSCVPSAATYTTVAATLSPDATAAFSGDNDDDVWFQFTATASAHRMELSSITTVSGTTANLMYEVTDACGNFPFIYGTLFLGYTTLRGLTPGNVYKIRVYTEGNGSRNTFKIAVCNPAAAPSNDECISPLTLTMNTGCVPEGPYSTLDATTSAQTSGDASGRDDDLWFTFTTGASQTTAQVTLSDIQAFYGNTNMVMELWANCADPTYINWYPSSTSINVYGLSSTTTYRLRVYSYSSSSRVQFKICVANPVLPPSNDTYFTSQLVTLSGSSTCTTIFTGGTTLNATTEMPPACSGAASPPKDLWYKFIPSDPRATIQLTNITGVAGSSTSMYMELFRGSNTNSVLCSSTNALDLDGSDIAHTLLPGTTYYLRVYNADATSACTFNICSKTLPPPVNDDCPGAINVPVNASTAAGESLLKVTASSVGATNSAPALTCSGSSAHDLWFKFTAPASGKVNISLYNQRILVNVSFAELNWGTYTGNCAALTAGTCNYSPNGSLTGLTPGAVYYVRVFDNAGNQSAFDITIREIPSTATNTTCATASALNGNWKTGATLGLSGVNVVPCFGGPALSNKELWYSFTATSAKHLLDFYDMVKLSADQNNLGYKVYAGTCAAPGTAIYCVDNVVYGNGVINGLTIGNTYYVQLLENTYNGGPMMYKIRTIPQAAPANDESSGAITVVQNPDCQNISGSFKFAGMSANPAAGTFSGDVWYKFVAASTGAMITINSYQYLAVYNSDATTVFNDPGTGGNSLTLAGMTAGNTYYIRLYNTASSPSFGPDADFTICIAGTPSVAAADDPTPGSSCITIDGPATSTNSGRWLHLTHLGKMVASVMDTSGAPGMGAIAGKYYINSGSVRADATGIEYLNRNFEITPSTQPTKPVAVRLYFTKTEFDAMIAANDGDGNDVYYLNDLKISKFSSNPCSNTLTIAGEVLYNINNWGSLSSNVYYIEVIVPSFSSFFLKNISGTLPVRCIGFAAERKQNSVRLRWTTATESNTERFEIQRSLDGRNYEKIGSVKAAGNSTAMIDYSFSDATLPENIGYYRLLLIDKDGSQQFACNTSKVGAGVTRQIFGNIYPNPVKDEMTVQLQRSVNGNVRIQVLSSMGQVLQQKSVRLQPSDVKIAMSTSALAKGVYMLRLQTAEGVETIRFTKQ
jgi:hypothetical protein